MTAARRGLLAAMAVLGAPATAVATELRFRIIREGRQIGTHRVVLTEDGGLAVARTEVDIAVRVAGITVFRLTHRFEEAWQGERLQRVSSRLDRNGRVSTFTGAADAAGLRITGGEGPAMLPGEAAPLTWWDARRFDRPLFSNDTAKPLRLTWTRAAREAGGVRWRCAGDEQGEGGYAADGTWIEWETRAEDGSLVTYVRA